MFLAFWVVFIFISGPLHMSKQVRAAGQAGVKALSTLAFMLQKLKCPLLL